MTKFLLLLHNFKTNILIDFAPVIKSSKTKVCTGMELVQSKNDVERQCKMAFFQIPFSDGYVRGSRN